MTKLNKSILYNLIGDFMVLYLDLIILSNLLITYIFIKTIKVIYKEKFKITQFIFSMLISIISFILFFVPFKYIYNLRYFVGVIIALIAFYKRDFKTVTIQICIFYILNISFIGSLVIFKIDTFLLLFICALFISSLWFIDSFKKDKSGLKTNYKVRINNHTYVGYLDTGNNSYCDNIPIVYIDNKELDENYSFFKTIQVFTINGFTQIDIYNGPLICINKNNFFVYYAFIKSLGKKVILNKELGE